MKTIKKISVIYYLCICLIYPSMLAAQGNISGFRDVQVRSKNVITARLGYMATTDTLVLKDKARYSIISPDDADFEAPVHPTTIARFSKGSRSAGGPFDRRALSDQFMHLYFDKSFKPGKLYILSLEKGLIPEDMQRTKSFRFDQTPNPGYKLNQVGFSQESKTKHIYLSSYLGDGEPVDLSTFNTFQVKNAATEKTVYKGTIQHITDYDLQGHDNLYLIDLSEFKQNGEFYIWVEGLGRSYNFKNGQTAAEEIYHIISRGMYFQRRGIKIDKTCGGPWARPLAHHQVYVTKKNIVHPWKIGNIQHPWSKNKDQLNPLDPASGDYYVAEGPREIRGGHYDAGDFDTRLTHLVVSDKLMTLYEALPENFKDGQCLIPERENGIPDILDEAAWSLLHWEMLQDFFAEVRGEFGPVPAGVESWTHPPQYAATGEADILPYYMRKATPYSTFCGAAVFAQAARVFQEFDPNHALKFLERACAAYDYAKKHRDEKWDPENPKILPLAWEEVYDDDALQTAWCWAAAQLYSTTGEKEYWQDFKKYHKHIADEFLKQYPWRAIAPVVLVSNDKQNSKIVQEIKQNLLQKASETVDWILENGKNGYQASVPNKGVWGFCNPITQQEILWLAYYITHEQKYLDAIAQNVDFTLGMNPSEMSWMTGAGTVYPVDPLSINSKFDNVEEPIPGIVIFGPTDNWQHKHNPLYPNPEKMGFYRRISDCWNYVEGCEYVVDEQQTNMYVSAGILLGGHTTK